MTKPIYEEYNIVYMNIYIDILFINLFIQDGYLTCFVITQSEQFFIMTRTKDSDRVQNHWVNVGFDSVVDDPFGNNWNINPTRYRMLYSDPNIINNNNNK